MLTAAALAGVAGLSMTTALGQPLVGEPGEPGVIDDAVIVDDGAVVGPTRYWEEPGVREFTGVMTVRPLPVGSLERIYGGDADMAFRAHERAHELLRTEYAVVSTVAATGEVRIAVPGGETESSVAEVLLSTGLFAYAEPDWRLFPLNLPNDPQLGNQWHHPVIDSAEAWAFETGTPDIITAYVDTGFDQDHPDLETQYVLGYNSADRVAQADGGRIEDINGHGTAVAGTGAARGDNGEGVSGVGWNLGVMPIRTTNSSGGGASLSNILAGARWAIDNGARIASCSYSGVDAQSINASGEYIWDRGGLLVYAAGNDDRNLVGFDHEFAIVVGATQPNDSKSGFSAFGRGVDVFAPGSSIRTTRNGGGYTSVSGTSFATPMVNGLLGLIWSVDPDNLTNEAVQQVLFASADDLAIRVTMIFGGTVGSTRAGRSI